MQHFSIKGTEDMQKWEMDPFHSELMFRIEHLTIAHISGKIESFTVGIEKTRESFEDARIQVKADASSLTTFIKYRDDSLKSSTFFDVERYPNLGFISTSFQKLDNKGNFRVEGNLELKGISKQLVLQAHLSGPVVDDSNPRETVTKMAFNVKGEFDRREWGINFNAPLKSGGFILGNMILISAEVEFTLKEE